VSPRAAGRAACALLLGLVALGISWELWLAPLRPGGSWLVLKVLPLLLPLRGMLRGDRYTFKWTSLLVWPYACEGAARLMTDPQPSATLAGIEAFLALSLFAAIVAYLRASRIA
jgi:uncharacterized membrane protein